LIVVSLFLIIDFLLLILFNYCVIIFFVLGTVELPADKFVSEEDNVNTLARKKIVLNSNDEIFAETRYTFQWIYNKSL